MTQYLKVTVGEGSYLFESSQVLEVRPASAKPEAAAIDCRRLFGASATTPGCQVVLATAVLIVDRFDGLVVLDDAELRPLPPIGRLGGLIDAVSLPAAGEPPALRLRLDPALLARAADYERATS